MWCAASAAERPRVIASRGSLRCDTPTVAAFTRHDDPHASAITIRDHLAAQGGRLGGRLVI